MAHRMVVDEGTNTNNVDEKELADKQSLITHLTEHKLPINKFISFGIDINDLINFDDNHFKGLCYDMKLNSLESLRFAKLIQELNPKNNKHHDPHSQLVQQIQNDAEYAQLKIDTSFNALVEKLNQRRKYLKETLNQITQLKIDDISSNKVSQQNMLHKTNCIEFIFSDFSDVQQMLSSIGKIEDKSSKPPLFSLRIPDNNGCCIQVIINIDEQKQDEKLKYDIKYKEEEQKEWSTTNSLKIENENIKPLTKYVVSLRHSVGSNYNASQSEWSEMQSIQTRFDCVWHPKYHGKDIKLIASNEMFVNANCSTSNDSYCCSSIVGKYQLNGEVLKKVKYEFIINEFCQPSMFGLVEYPLDVTMKYHWNSDSPLVENKYSYLVSAVDGLKYVRRYKKGKNTETGMWSLVNDGIALKNVIKKGDHFIFDIDFERNVCNLYINDEHNKVRNKKEEATWTHIANRLYPCYSHYCDPELISKNSRVKINLISYELKE